MIDTNSAVMEAATALGFNSDSTEANPSSEVATESKDAASETTNEEVKEPGQEEVEATETPSPEGEGEESTEPVKVEEAPKTAQELQEIEAKVKDLELKEHAFMERMQAKEKEFQQVYQEKLKAHDELDSWLADIANKDPELFDVIRGSFQEHQKQFNNPMIASLREEQAKIKAELDGFKAKASDEVTRTKLDAEMNQVKSTIGKEAEAAGVKIDWAKVEDVWADNPKLDLKGAVFAIYGDNMMKAFASKAKVSVAEKKIQSRPTVTTAGNVARTNASSEPALNKGDVSGMVAHFARKYGANI